MADEMDPFAQDTPDPRWDPDAPEVEVDDDDTLYLQMFGATPPDPAELSPPRTSPASSPVRPQEQEVDLADLAGIPELFEPVQSPQEEVDLGDIAHEDWFGSQDGAPFQEQEPLSPYSYAPDAGDGLVPDSIRDLQVRSSTPDWTIDELFDLVYYEEAAVPGLKPAEVRARAEQMFEASVDNFGLSPKSDFVWTDHAGQKWIRIYALVPSARGKKVMNARLDDFSNPTTSQATVTPHSFGFTFTLDELVPTADSTFVSILEELQVPPDFQSMYRRDAYDAFQFCVKERDTNAYDFLMALMQTDHGFPPHWRSRMHSMDLNNHMYGIARNWITVSTTEPGAALHLYAAALHRMYKIDMRWYAHVPDSVRGMSSDAVGPELTRNMHTYIEDFAKRLQEARESERSGDRDIMEIDGLIHELATDLSLVLFYYRPFASGLLPCFALQHMTLRQLRDHLMAWNDGMTPTTMRIRDIQGNPIKYPGKNMIDGIEAQRQLTPQDIDQYYADPVVIKHFEHIAVISTVYRGSGAVHLLHAIMLGQQRMDQALCAHLFRAQFLQAIHAGTWAPPLDNVEMAYAEAVDKAISQGRVQSQMRMRRHDYATRGAGSQRVKRTVLDAKVPFYADDEEPGTKLTPTRGRTDAPANRGVKPRLLGIRGLLDDALTSTHPIRSGVYRLNIIQRFEEQKETPGKDAFREIRSLDPIKEMLQKDTEGPLGSTASRTPDAVDAELQQRDANYIPSADELRLYHSHMKQRTILMSLRTMPLAIDTPAWRETVEGVFDTSDLQVDLLPLCGAKADAADASSDHVFKSVDAAMWTLARRFAVVRGIDNIRMSAYYDHETRALCDFAAHLLKADSVKKNVWVLKPELQAFDSVAGRWRDFMAYRKINRFERTRASEYSQGYEDRFPALEPIPAGQVPPSASDHWDAICNVVLMRVYERLDGSIEYRERGIDAHVDVIALQLTRDTFFVDAMRFLRRVFLQQCRIVWLARGHTNRLPTLPPDPAFEADVLQEVRALRDLLALESGDITRPLVQVQGEHPFAGGTIKFLQDLSLTISQVPLFEEAGAPVGNDLPARFTVGTFMFLYGRLFPAMDVTTGTIVLPILHRLIVAEQADVEGETASRMYTVFEQYAQFEGGRDPSDSPRYARGTLVATLGALTAPGMPIYTDVLSEVPAFNFAKLDLMVRFVTSPLSYSERAWSPVLRGSSIAPPHDIVEYSYAHAGDVEGAERYASAMVKRPGTSEIRFNWNAGASTPPALRTGEEGFVVRFYVPGSADAAEVDWDDSVHEIVMSGAKDKGLGILLLARLGVSVHPKDKPHGRLSIRGLTLATSSMGKQVTIRDPSDNYAPVAVLRLENFGGWPDQDLPHLMKVPTQLLRDYERQNALTPPPLVPATDRMRLRRYTTAVGELPAAAFALEGERGPPASVKLVDYLLEAGAYMAGWSYQDLMEALRSIVDKRPRQLSDTQVHALRIAFSGLSLVGTSNDYVSDIKGEGADAERFQIPLGQGLGIADCEDVAKECQRLCRAIQRMKQLSKSTGRDHVMHKIMQEYDIIMLTAVATTAALRRTDSTDAGQDPSQYICHVFSAAIPTSAIDTMMGIQIDALPGRENRLQEGLIKVGGVILEGTNFTTPLLRELPAYIRDDKMAKTCANAKWQELAVRSDRDVFPSCVDELGYELSAVPTLHRPESLAQFSSFYRFVTGAWIVREGIDAIDFMVLHAPDGGNATRRTTSSQPLAFGVSMQDFVELQPTVKIVSYYATPPAVKEKMLDVLEYQPPLFPYGPDATAQNSALGGSMWKRLRKLQSNLRFADRYPLWKPFVDIRLQHINEITEKRYAEIKRMVQEGGWKLDARVFPMRENIAVYCIRMVPTEADKAGAGRYVARFKKMMP